MITRRARFVLGTLVPAAIVVSALGGVVAETRAASTTSVPQKPAATVTVVDPAGVPAALDRGSDTAPIVSESLAGPAETIPDANDTVPPAEAPLQVADADVSGPSASAIVPDSGAAITSAPTTWSLDLYDSRAERWQGADYTACTAASTESMLNTIAYDGSASALVWVATTSYSTQKSILAYERAHMTMLQSSAGSDPHGWRNALNYYGWGSTNAGVYRDASYGSFDAAARAAVSAMARTHEPVGILAHAGGHAEFVTGYVVTGADPETGSTAFTIVSVNLTDPLRYEGHSDTAITYAQWRSGGAWVRFSAYMQTDSPYTDPIDGRVGNSEWYGKWVLIEPVRQGDVVDSPRPLRYTSAGAPLRG